jgi:YtkA-like
MKRPAVALGGLAAVAIPGIVAAQDCGAALGAGVARAESKSYVVAWRPEPQPIVVSRHFALEIVVCPKNGAPQPRSLAVDATMPAHRHGMNYKPAVNALAEGRYRAEGLMFHMPGRWEFAFDVAGRDGVERVRAGFDLQ